MNAIASPNSTRLCLLTPSAFGEEALAEADRIALLVSVRDPSVQWDVVARDDASHVILWWSGDPALDGMCLEPDEHDVIGGSVRGTLSRKIVSAAPTPLDALRRARTALEEITKSQLSLCAAALGWSGDATHPS